jgi:hypothetical protein
MKSQNTHLQILSHKEGALDYTNLESHLTNLFKHNPKLTSLTWSMKKHTQKGLPSNTMSITCSIDL